MELKLITATTCPVCNAKIVAESCRQRHCNGQGFEFREFACGAVLEWSPNFERLLQNKPCPESAEEKEKKHKNATALLQLREFIQSLNVEPEFRESLLNAFRYM